MSSTLLQINFTFTMSIETYVAMACQAATSIAKVKGLQWKIWLLNETEQRAGGIYLFASTDAAQDYVAGPIITQLRQLPTITNFSTNLFDTVNEATALTHGPIAVTNS